MKNNESNQSRYFYMLLIIPVMHLWTGLSSIVQRQWIYFVYDTFFTRNWLTWYHSLTSVSNRAIITYRLSYITMLWGECVFYLNTLLWFLNLHSQWCSDRYYCIIQIQVSIILCSNETHSKDISTICFVSLLIEMQKR